ncbi:hypothetical protein HZH66_011160 [Vespula vulgaris]|uniref:C2H2-type domain-containing protein n=1 Tax=Vespula vulgaris TaxID=7454 RepID=A0A834JED7_VESVU|nr:hypothetical protein HZH66_011160 [Vespula vulgaris]
MFEKNLKKKRDSHFVFVEPEREMEQGNNTINDWPNNSMMMMTTTTTTMTTTTTTMTTTTMTINANTRKKFYCPKCNNGYSRLSDMKTHCQFQCGKEPRYQCPYCLFASFRSASQRLRYLNRYYRSIVRYPCMNCTSVYNKRGSLMTHLRYECGQPPRFKCPYCDMISKKTSNVQQHIRRKHKGSVVYVQDTHLLMMDSFMSFVSPTSGNNDVPTTTEQLQHNQLPQKLLYYCPKCLHGFTLKSNRNRHFRYECGHEPRFKCPYCELRSKQTSQIYCHIRKKHPMERVYVVDLKS